MTKMLEIGLDYDLSQTEIDRHTHYVATGMTEDAAWRQIAQDAFGSTGGIVQQADLVEW